MATNLVEQCIELNRDKGQSDWGAAYYAFRRDPFCLGYPVYSSLLVCPVCCTIWAKLTMENDTKAHRPQAAVCQSCFPTREAWDGSWPGSILQNDLISTSGWDQELLKAMPLELLQREFELTLKVIENDTVSNTLIFDTPSYADWYAANVSSSRSEHPT